MSGRSTTRGLGTGEVFYWLVDRVCSTNFTVAARLSGPLDQDRLAAALSTVQVRHPLLRVRISVEKGRPVFRADAVGPIPLRTADTPEDAWVACAEAEINETFDWQRGPLARCAWLRHPGGRSTLMVTFHHAVGDGISGGYLIRDLLRAAADPDTEIPPPSPAPPPEPLDSRVPPVGRGVRGIIRYIGENARAGSAVARHGMLSAVRADARAPLRGRRARAIATLFDSAFTAGLSLRARREQTTVHGALAAAILLGGRHEVPSGRPRLMALGSPVNMRERVLPPVGEEVGMYASVMGTLHCVGPDTPFWDLAREVTGGVTAGFARDMHFTYEPMTFRILSTLVGLTGTSDAGAARFTRLASGLFPSTGFGLTNVGRLDVAEYYGPMNVSWVALLPSWSVFAHSGWSACTTAGRLSLVLVYMEPMLTRPHAEALAGRTVEILRTAV